MNGTLKTLVIRFAAKSGTADMGIVRGRERGRPNASFSGIKRLAVRIKGRSDHIQHSVPKTCIHMYSTI